MGKFVHNISSTVGFLPIRVFTELFLRSYCTICHKVKQNVLKKMLIKNFVLEEGDYIS